MKIPGLGVFRGLYEDAARGFEAYGAARMFGVNNINGKLGKSLLEMKDIELNKSMVTRAGRGLRNWWNASDMVVGGMGPANPAIVNSARRMRRGAVGLGIGAGAYGMSRRRRY